MTYDLKYDGDIHDLDDTHRLVLHVECDQDASINDYESDGKVSYYIDYHHSHDERPTGFTGRAMKIDADRSGFVWWEPYGDEMGWQDDAGEWHHAKWEQLPPEVRRKERNRIADLIQEGFKLVGVELQQLLIDERGNEHWTEVWIEWCGGVDSVYPELIDELASEVQVPM